MVSNHSCPMIRFSWRRYPSHFRFRRIRVPRPQPGMGTSSGMGALTLRMFMFMYHAASLCSCSIIDDDDVDDEYIGHHKHTLVKSIQPPLLHSHNLHYCMVYLLLYVLLRTTVDELNLLNEDYRICNWSLC